MNSFAFSTQASKLNLIGEERTPVIQVSNFFECPDDVFEAAGAQSYAHINAHYPGVRAAVEQPLLDALCQCVSDLVSSHLGQDKRPWMGQAWYSIVTRPAQTLTPIQRLPHFDEFDETQLAVMIYLNRTLHGGTAFYRQRTTGFERVTEARYQDYKTALEQGVKQSGLPPAAYISDGGPHFEKIFESDAAFNSMILYPGTSLHSGVIRNDVALSADPAIGRLTINGFFRPT